MSRSYIFPLRLEACMAVAVYFYFLRFGIGVVDIYLTNYKQKLRAMRWVGNVVCSGKWEMHCTPSRET
jgi:hypothetical protein